MPKGTPLTAAAETELAATVASDVVAGGGFVDPDSTTVTLPIEPPLFFWQASQVILHLVIVWIFFADVYLS